MSPDWMVNFSWILDHMYMFGTSTHYILPDPAYRPIESMSFFRVDCNWMGAFDNGALSITNHLPNDDIIPQELEKANAINKHLDTKRKRLTHPPGFGFLLRSELCVKFPDLIVEAFGENAVKPVSTLTLRQANIVEGILLVLFAKKHGAK